MDEIIAILKNPEKVDQLILKLKTLGEQSPQFQTFKNSMDSFHLNLPPKGVDQKNILQTIFKYSDPLECFQTFRLVCKSWQNAVETIRFDKAHPYTLTQQMCEAEMNHQTRMFFSKYLKCFKQVKVQFCSSFDQTKWDMITSILVTNMKNLNQIRLRIGQQISSTNVMLFLFDLFENSQTTLTYIAISSSNRDKISLPTISLPNMRTFQITINPIQNSQVNSFKYLIKTFVVKCPDLKEFQILKIKNGQNILDYLIKNHPQHFVCAPQARVLEHIPLKFSHLKLQNLAAYRFLSQVEYLILHVPNFQNPSEGGWSNYQEILNFCPKLKGIIFYYKKKYFDFTYITDSDFANVISIMHIQPSAHNIWKRRFEYFKSKNIQLLTYDKYTSIVSEVHENVKSWYFHFKHIK